ncbi:DUF1365 domain-containing protein [Pseudooceanicola sp. MF1-13]|uniref:DUF1365 domain-containing protein n=1 Tax=Pseudooceanicola sp. MF1-13 TaxID=3379095 RepID=UPI003891D28D
MTAQQPYLLTGHTWHGRKGAIKNAFRYGVDYVLLDAEADLKTPSLFSRNAGNIVSLHDSDHGGAPKQGKGAAWVRDVLRTHALPAPDRIRLLTQPRVWGHVFNPVSFWLCENASGQTTAIIAEVTNTFGDRHSYLCTTDGPIAKDSDIKVRKVMHVSPFQPQTGSYAFRFDLSDDRIGIKIDYGRDGGGVIATLVGDLTPMTNAGLLRAMIRRPFGSLRVLALIHWQAVKLKVKGARYRPRPAPPTTEMTPQEPARSAPRLSPETEAT